jgi:HEAT repeat protein
MSAQWWRLCVAVLLGACIMQAAWPSDLDKEPDAATKQILDEIDRIVAKNEVPAKYRTLLQWLRTSPSDRVQVRCGDALAKFVSPEVRDAAISICLGPADEKALWRRESAYQALLGQASIVRDEHVRKLLARDLTHCGPCFDLAGLADISEDTRAKFLAYANNEKQTVAYYALNFIETETGLSGRYPGRKKALPPEVMARHMEVLGRLTRPGPDRGPVIRFSAASALYRLGRKDAGAVMAARLEEMLKDAKKEKGERLSPSLCGYIELTHGALGRKFRSDEFRSDEQCEKGINALAQELRKAAAPPQP